MRGFYGKLGVLVAMEWRDMVHMTNRLLGKVNDAWACRPATRVFFHSVQVILASGSKAGNHKVASKCC